MKFEGLAFLALIGCVLSLTVSLLVMPDRWSAIGSVVSVILGVLAGGLYGLSATREG